jgi:hypothetical protein
MAKGTLITLDNTVTWPTWTSPPPNQYGLFRILFDLIIHFYYSDQIVNESAWKAIGEKVEATAKLCFNMYVNIYTKIIEEKNTNF